MTETTYAVAIEYSNETLEEEGLRGQVVLFPSAQGTIALHRYTNGRRGRGNAWQFTNSPLTQTPTTREWLTRKPVAFPIPTEDNDESTCRSATSKAVAALNKSEEGNVSLGEKLPVFFHDLVVNTSEENNALTVLLPEPKSKATQKVEDSETSEAENEALMLEEFKARANDPHPAPECEGLAAEPEEFAEALDTITAVAEGDMSGGHDAVTLVPGPELAKKYVSRTLAGQVSDLDMVAYAQKHHENVLLLGPTGSGKTTLPVAYASKHRLPLYSVSGNVAMEPSQLFGKFVPTGTPGEFTWIDGPVTTLVRHGGVLILDEINLISPKIITVLYPLLDARREITLLDHAGEVIKAHKDLVVVATGNPGYTGTHLLSEALHDRFTHRHTWDYDEEVEEKLINSAALRKMTNAIRENAEIDTPFSTRLVQEFEALVAGLGWEYAVDNLANRFSDTEEQGAVRGLVQTYEHNIKTDLGIAKKSSKPTRDALWTAAGVANWA